jgi:hypothetical protein
MACRSCLEIYMMAELQFKMSMSWIKCFLQGFSMSRSREQSAGEVFWLTCLLSFLGFTKLLCLRWLVIILPLHTLIRENMITQHLLESDSSQHFSFPITQVIFHLPGKLVSYKVNIQKFSVKYSLIISSVLFPSHQSYNMLRTWTSEVFSLQV